MKDHFMKTKQGQVMKNFVKNPTGSWLPLNAECKVELKNVTKIMKKFPKKSPKKTEQSSLFLAEN